jgi:V-type H+-transporting ATPase subunit H
MLIHLLTMSNRDPSLSPSSASVRAAESSEAERELRDIEADKSFSISVLTREINWKGYSDNNFLNQKELGLLLDYDKQSSADQSDVLAEKGAAYAALFIKCLDVIRTKETVEYIIVLVDQLLFNDPRRANNFHALVANNIDPFKPFLRILENSSLLHPYIINRACHILAILLSTSNQQKSPAMQEFIRYVINILKCNTSSSRDLIHILSALKPLLTREQTQELFIELDGLNSLAAILNRDLQNAQLIYTIGFNLWLLSYSEKIAIKIVSSGILRKLVHLLRVSIMEKVLRIIFSILKNLVQLGISNNNDIAAEEMIGLGLINVIDTLQKRKFKDADIVPDMNYCYEILTSTIQKLSSFELYQSEVLSGALTWSPAHTNEQFWRENINQFEHKGFKIIQRLIELLADEDDSVREIAASDLGEFARFHPEGKRIIQKLGGKAKLMVNLQSKNPKLAKAALLATQKLMVNNWEFLAKSSAGGVASLVSKQNK